jgi:hypothetical protein
LAPRLVRILGRRGVRAANRPLPFGVERCQTRVTRDVRVKGFPNVAEVMKPLRRAVLKLSPVGKPQAIFAIVGHFSAREMAFSFPGEASVRLQDYCMGYNDDQPPSTETERWNRG